MKIICFREETFLNKTRVSDGSRLPCSADSTTDAKQRERPNYFFLNLSKQQGIYLKASVFKIAL
jgi:hypothetical protein